jgi:hypothetical protein
VNQPAILHGDLCVQGELLDLPLGFSVISARYRELEKSENKYIEIDFFW